MSWVEIFLIALGLSADAFAVSVSLGLGTAAGKYKESSPATNRNTRYVRCVILTVGLYFGIFQAVMPLIGYIAAAQFSGPVSAYGNLIAFGLLCLIGGKMIVDSLKKQKVSETQNLNISPVHMVPLAVATSIDALAVGASFALLQVSILAAAALIGITTFALSATGVKVGNTFGAGHQAKAGLIGGVILVLIGLRILLL